MFSAQYSLLRNKGCAILAKIVAVEFCWQSQKTLRRPCALLRVAENKNIERNKLIFSSLFVFHFEVKMATAKKSYHEVLEISQDATFEDVRKAYKRLCLQWHPDKNPDKIDEATKKMQEIGEAYSVLKKRLDDGGNFHSI